MTSFMLWEISTTPRPWSASRRTRSSTWRVWATPSAAVGSSRKTTLLFHSTALAMATVWRWPPERLATSWRTEETVRTERPAQRLAGLALHLAVGEDAEPADLASQEHVLGDVEVVGQREVLVDELDAEPGGDARDRVM